ncbi:hypothetical protein GCM10009765_32280 [Fodinicola feengrottensis]|uniref:Uncharacterized protein n=1 Tax=Fodinicola feengrottensis TaxID=435914 RepID=A0ABP4T188_9ACTN
MAIQMPHSTNQMTFRIVRTMPIITGRSAFRIGDVTHFPLIGNATSLPSVLPGYLPPRRDVRNAPLLASGASNGALRTNCGCGKG